LASTKTVDLIRKIILFLLTELQNFLKVGLLGLAYVGNARSGDSSRCTTGLQIWNTLRFAVAKIVRVRRGQRE